MAGYLDNYGAGEEQREKLIKRVAIVLVAVIVVGGVAFFFLKNYRQEKQVKTFFDLLKRKTIKQRTGCGAAPTRSRAAITALTGSWRIGGRTERIRDRIATGSRRAARVVPG